MKISNIKQQEKNKSRYSVFVDGKYEFSLSESALLEQKLALGFELNTKQLGDFKKLSADDKTYNQALRYIALRPRSIWEMEFYLKRKNIGEPEARKIIDKLTALDLLDDEKFARAWAESRRLLKPISKRRLIQELRQKHVSNEIIEQVLSEDETDEIEILHELVAKKRIQTKYKNDTQKLMRYLAAQGFNYVDIKTAVQET